MQQFELDPAKIAAAEAIVTGPSGIITKATRCGFTTSGTAALDELEIPALIVTPTNKIRESTVSQATSSFLPVLAHRNCERVKKKLEEDPFLENLPIPIPDCLDCGEMSDCLVFAARCDFAMTTSMTYSKLQTLMLTDSRESQEIRNALQDRVKAVIFDESHVIGRGNVASIEYDASIRIPEPIPGEYPPNEKKQDKFSFLRKIFHGRFWRLKEEHREQARSL
ncbi:MAG: hypothetical protein MUO26_11425, partial [Methanotrichaceae archaeon]|nr:hypothetical protein [Methanotrichaceae archaeon]